MKNTITSIFSKHMAQAVALSTAMCISGGALATNTLTPRALINKFSEQYKVSDNAQYNKIVVKFKEGTGVRLGDFGLSSIISNPEMPSLFGMDWSGFNMELTGVNDILSAQGLNLIKKFSTSEEKIDELRKIGEERTGKQLADLNLYFNIEIPSFLNNSQIQAILNSLNSFETVEIAYADNAPQPASITPDFQDYDADHDYYQGYLNEPGDTNGYIGINAKYAWNFSGGRGNGVNVVDVEGGWRTTHEDFPTLAFDYNTEFNNSSWINHGTAVVGVIGAPDNGYGVTGIANQANIGVSNIYNGDDTDGDTTDDVADAIERAASLVGEGGIVLIELHYGNGEDGLGNCDCNDAQCGFTPAEHRQANYDAIELATAAGVIVIEAGGNGSADLDDSKYNSIFDRSYRDSGAIMIGASRAKSSEPMCWTNYGSRIDVRGWGELVATLDYGTMYKDPDDETNSDKMYSGTFSGTSSASPIVTGAAAVIQGISQNVYGKTLTPEEMRNLLTNNGTDQEIELEKHIGALPDLAKAITVINQNNAFNCSEFNNTNSEHEASGRAYSETTIEGQTCWGTYCYGGTEVTTWYAAGTDIDLGTNGDSENTLHEGVPGEYAVGNCPVNDNPALDNTAPVITLAGDNPVTVYQGSDFTDPGATAEDNVDGDITSEIVVTGYVDTNTIDTYELVYTVSDAAGNQATETRTVNVIAIPACQEYTDTVSNHESAGRAYSVTETTGQTCYGSWCWGGTTTTTWYAEGSDENLGTDSSATVTLIDSDGGYVTGNCPTDPVAPVLVSYEVTSNNYTQAVITGVASDADGDIDRVVLGLGAVTGITCEGTTNFTCTLVWDDYGFEVGAEVSLSLSAWDSRNEGSNVEQFMLTRPEQQASVPPVISNIQQTREGTVEIVTVTVTDVDDDLDTVFLYRIDDMGVVECSNISGDLYRCEMQLQGTDYATMTWKARAIDIAENVTDSAEFTVEWEEPASCYTATNSEHISADRATLQYNVLVYANGSNDYLGMSGDTTSLEETSDGVWTKVSNCD